MINNPSLTTHLYPATPCNRVDGGKENLSSVGICFSGGGSRALAASMGQLRGLQKIGALAKIQAISALSGSAWAALLYTYLPETIDDNEFLGPVVSPQDLLLSFGPDDRNLNHLAPHCLGQAPTRFPVEGLVPSLFTFSTAHNYPFDELWARFIGHTVFSPFRLNHLTSDKKPARWYGSDDEWFETVVKKMNGHLRKEDFHFVKKRGFHRPTLIINSSIIVGRDGGRSFYPLQGGARWMGSLSQHGAIGGGGCEPFAFATSLMNVDPAHKTAQVTSDSRFSLSDLAAISGAEFTRAIAPALVERAREADLALSPGDLTPTYRYWSVGEALAGVTPPIRRYSFAGGGALDNSGLLGLLAQTDVQGAIVFVNSATPLRPGGASAIDAHIPPLFGIPAKSLPEEPESMAQRSHHRGHPGEGTRGAQIFRSELLDDLILGLWKNSARQPADPDRPDPPLSWPAWYKKRYTVMENKLFGIKGGRAVTVLWVYTNRVREWESSCLDPELKKQLTQAFAKIHFPWEENRLKGFPHYKTVSQLHLSPAQVNALGHLCCWSIQKLEQPIMDMLAELK